jgi:hypothetical protein
MELYLQDIRQKQGNFSAFFEEKTSQFGLPF